MPKFRFLSDITAQAIAFEAFGKTERRVFENAALALIESMVEIKTVKRKNKENIQLRSTSLADLLFAFLEHIIFIRVAKQMVFREVVLGIEKQGKGFLLQGFAYGERIDVTKHKLKSSIKAVSKHLFEFKKSESLYRAQVILEV